MDRPGRKSRSVNYFKMSDIKKYFYLGEAFRYFGRVFRKNNGEYPDNFNIRTMHWINRISIVMFLICVIVMIVRAIMR